MSDDELGLGAQRIEDPKGNGLRIWFQIVPEKMSTKNGIHIDVNAGGPPRLAFPGPARAGRG